MFYLFNCRLHVQLASDATVRHSCVVVGGGYKRYTHQDETQLSAVAYTVLYPLLNQTGKRV